MATIAKTIHHVDTTKVSGQQLSGYNSLIKRLEFSHFSVIAMALLIGSCMGGITTMKIFQNHAPDWQFIVSLGFAMANLVACIAQAPTKWVVNLFVACMLVNGILLFVNVI